MFVKVRSPLYDIYEWNMNVTLFYIMIHIVFIAYLVHYVQPYYALVYAVEYQ